MHQRVASRFGAHLPYERGISVGGGAGGKEMDLLEAGIVEHLTLYELSSVRIEAGRELADSRGLADRICFLEGDAFACETTIGAYDLVHWDNSLHHMLDVPAAIEWSRAMLRPHGLFYLYDFVGPARFQWPPSMLDLATAVRQALPSSYLVDPNDRARSVTTVFEAPPSIESMIASDPSEAADSDRTLGALRRVFPDAEVLLTGGVVYSLALNDIIHNFSWDPVDPLLDLLMLLDFQAADAGLTHYAAALATKI